MELSTTLNRMRWHNLRARDGLKSVTLEGRGTPLQGKQIHAKAYVRGGMLHLLCLQSWALFYCLRLAAPLHAHGLMQMRYAAAGARLLPKAQLVPPMAAARQGVGVVVCICGVYVGVVNIRVCACGGAAVHLLWPHDGRQYCSTWMACVWVRMYNAHGNDHCVICVASL